MTLMCHSKLSNVVLDAVEAVILHTRTLMPSFSVNGTSTEPEVDASSAYMIQAALLEGWILHGMWADC